MDSYEPIPGLAPRVLEGPPLVKGAVLDKFVRDLMARLMRETGVKGAAVAVVKGGAVVHSAGYGTADIARTDAAVTEHTLFRVGSTSKLFTATAVLQQVQRKVLDLDRDVNAYLPFRVPSMTLRNLLTHSSGVEENQLGWMMKESAADLVPLEENVRAHVPAQVRRPTTDFRNDRASAYSNWGFALMGVIVSRVSGLPFDDYMDQEVFGRLAMGSSTFREPLPRQLVARMSKGHFAGSGDVMDFEYWHSIGPAGSLATTAADMSRFMLAHLGKGGDILRPETAALMHDRAMAQHPRVNGAGLCFYEAHQNGRRILCHRGKGLCFQSDLSLIPGESAGFFVVLNTGIKSPVLRAAAASFVDEYFPAEIPDGSARERPRTAARYAGTYRGIPHAYESIEKFMLLTCGERFESVATKVDDSTLLIRNLGGGDSQWEELEPGVLRKIGGQDQVAIVPDAGRGADWMLGPFAFGASRKIRWFESRSFHVRAFNVTRAGLAAAMVGWLAAVLTGSAWSAGGLALGLAALFGALALPSYKVLWDTIRFPPASPLPFRYPRKVQWALTMILVSIPLALAVGLCAVAAWVYCWWGIAGTLCYTILAALELAFLALLHHWKLVGYRYG